MEANRKIKHPVYFLFAILLLHFLCWILLKPPVPHADDLCYVQEGEKIVNGVYEWNDSPKNHRLGIILPSLFFIRVFGNNPYSVSLFPLLCSMATIAFLYFFLLKFNFLLAITSSILLSFNIIQIIYSTVLFPDLIVSLWAFLMVVMIYEGRKKENNFLKYSLLGILFFLIGFFTKEIILLILPFAMVISYFDLKKGSSIKFWKSFYVLLVSCIGIIFLISYLLKGDGLFIYNSIEKNHNDAFVLPMNSMEIINRLTIAPIKFLFENYGYTFLILLAIPAFFIKEKNKEEGNLFFYWKIYFVCLLILLWFGTSSITRWAPILLFDRMWMMLIVPLCILGGMTIEKASSKFIFINNKPWFTAVIILLPYVAFAFYFIYHNSNHTF
ncbi:MAG: hypothetical protein ACHQNT_01800 [Bacteroidia bacterium]